MAPERKAIIGDQTIEEFYWCGRVVVYVNNVKVLVSFDRACREARNAKNGCING